MKLTHPSTLSGVVQANPDQSKHLETAVLRLWDMPVDFAALRAESYTDSRIPLIVEGTAEEDAFRRDLTVNGLYFNVHTEEVEDYTGMGLYDIERRLLRTPLDPMITFMEV